MGSVAPVDQLVLTGTMKPISGSNVDLSGAQTTGPSTGTNDVLYLVAPGDNTNVLVAPTATGGGNPGGTGGRQNNGGGDSMAISDVIGSLIDAVTNVLSAIVSALQNYAGQIAELLVGGAVAYSAYRWGRNIFRGLTRMISLPF